jgi:hypothetical protein
MSRYRQRVSSNIIWFTCLFYYIFYFWFWFEPIKLAEPWQFVLRCLAEPWQFVLRCLYQSRKMRIMYLCVRGIDVASFWDFSVGFWNCSELWYFVFSILLVECLDYRQRVSWQFTWHKFCSVAAIWSSSSWIGTDTSIQTVRVQLDTSIQTVRVQLDTSIQTVRVQLDTSIQTVS